MARTTDLRDALLPLASGGVHFDSAPFDTQKPYIVITLIGGTPVGFLESQLADLKHRRFQINAWHESRPAAVSLGNLIEKTLIESTVLRATAMTGMAYQFDDVTDAKGTVQDFGLWLTD